VQLWRASSIPDPFLFKTMPFHINLLHEEQEQELQRRRDPVKIGLMIILFMLVLLVVYYMQQLQSLSSLKGQQTRLQSEWKELEPQSKEAAAEQIRLEGIIGSAEALQQYASGRFYMATVLESLTGMVPPTVQIRGVSLMASGEGNTLTGSIQGIAAAADPRSAADEFREQLNSTLTRHVFQSELSITSLEDENRVVEYQGQELRAARFDFEIRATIVEPTPTPTPTPTPRRR